MGTVRFEGDSQNMGWKNLDPNAMWRDTERAEFTTNKRQVNISGINFQFTTFKAATQVSINAIRASDWVELTKLKLFESKPLEELEIHGAKRLTLGQLKSIVEQLKPKKLILDATQNRFNKISPREILEFLGKCDRQGITVEYKAYLVTNNEVGFLAGKDKEIPSNVKRSAGFITFSKSPNEPWFIVKEWVAPNNDIPGLNKDDVKKNIRKSHPENMDFALDDLDMKERFRASSLVWVVLAAFAVAFLVGQCTQKKQEDKPQQAAPVPEKKVRAYGSKSAQIQIKNDWVERLANGSLPAVGNSAPDSVLDNFQLPLAD